MSLLNLEFGTEGTGDSHAYIAVSLPQGKTNKELLIELAQEIAEMQKHLYGCHVYLNGRITTHMAMALGHTLCHVVKSVSLFDPKDNQYYLVISH